MDEQEETDAANQEALRMIAEAAMGLEARRFTQGIESKGVKVTDWREWRDEEGHYHISYSLSWTESWGALAGDYDSGE